MKKMFKKSALLFVVAVICCTQLGHQVSVSAQNGESKESITLSPAISKPSTSAGSQFSGKLTIINDGEVDYRFLLYARPYSVKQESYDPNYTEVNERTEAYQWVQFEKTDITLSAGKTVEVPYAVTVPEKAKSGGHYAVLFAETQPKEAGGTQVARKKRVGSLLYITVSGDLINSGSLVGWDAKLWQKSKPLTTAFRVKNDGNVHFQVNSQVTYSNIFNKPRLQLNQEHFVLPGTTRMISANMEKTPMLGIYRVAGTVKFLDKNEVLPTKWIILLPIKVVNSLIVLIGLLVAWRVLIPRIKARRNKSNTAVRRGKK
ncbi:MAG TPA: hypothetical protein PJ984_02750 [Candidatus Saccharibacteria bacterium]|nr:hypothetical protein [Candidatus Saccharibacteria bacterium]